MEKKRFGLVGKDISYSFSKGYFTDKFSDLHLEGYSYENFDLGNIDEFSTLIRHNPEIRGLNVTIPYKEEVLCYLDELDPKAQGIGAVNTIKFKENRLVGYNTDAYGFQHSISPFLKAHHTSALIFGTGGASKAIAYVLGELNIETIFVSRHPDTDQIGYADIDRSVMEKSSVLINCTPLGTYPKVNEQPDIPYAYITSKHLLFDLIYNPNKTAFLKQGERQGAIIANGHRMLQLQADKAWEIWQE